MADACDCGDCGERRATLYCLQCDVERCTDCIEATHHAPPANLHGFLRLEVWHDLRRRAQRDLQSGRACSTTTMTALPIKNEVPMLRGKTKARRLSVPQVFRRLIPPLRKMENRMAAT